KVVDPPGTVFEGFQDKINSWGGTLNATKSVYGENDLIPLRITASSLTAGTPVDLYLKMDFKDSSTGSMYFSDWFSTMPVAASNGQATNPCGGITCSGTPITVNVPADDITGTYALPSGTPQQVAYINQAAGQVLTIYGASAASFVTQNKSDVGTYTTCGTGTSGNYCIDTGSGLKKTARI